MSKENKTIQVMVKASTSEHYDAASHAVIEVDLPLIDSISRKMAIAKKMRKEDDTFLSLNYYEYSAQFIDFCPGVEAEGEEGQDVGLSDDEFENALEGGSGLVLPESFDVEKCEITNISPMHLSVSHNDFWWEGWDKYVGTSGYVETYWFMYSELDEWRELLVKKEVTI